jgi:hypothetical protein
MYTVSACTQGNESYRHCRKVGRGILVAESQKGIIRPDLPSPQNDGYDTISHRLGAILYHLLVNSAKAAISMNRQLV